MSSMLQSNGGYPSFGAPPNIQSGTNDIQGVRWVSGLDEVRAASVPYGIRSIFMNTQESVFYVKNSSGRIDMFSFKQIPLPNPENFVTKEEFDRQAKELQELRSKYESLTQQSVCSTEQQPAQPVASAPANAELSGNSGASPTGVLQENSGYGTNGITA